MSGSQPDAASLSSSSHLQLLLSFLRSPLWQLPINSFIDEHCALFTPVIAASSHPLSLTPLHRQYTQLCDELLTTFLDALSLSAADLLTACREGLQCGEDSVKREVGELLVLEDYALFHARMVSRSLELDAQVLRMLEEQDSRRRIREAEQERQRLEGRHGGRSRQQQLEEDEEAALRAGLVMSMREAERVEKERAMEAADLEYAIALSLALQAEEARAAEAAARQPPDEQKEPRDATPPVIAAAKDSPRTAPLPPLGQLKMTRRAPPPSPPPVPAAAAAAISSSSSPSLSFPPFSSSSTVDRSQEQGSEEGKARHAFLQSQRSLLIERKRHAREAEMRSLEAKARRQVERKDEAEEEVEIEEELPSAAEADRRRRAVLMQIMQATLRAEAEKTIAARAQRRAEQGQEPAA